MKGMKVSVQKSKHVGLLTKIFLCGFAVYAAFTLISLKMQISERTDEVKALEQSVAQQEMTNAQLSEILENGMTDEYIADAARDKLGYVKPGERVFVDTSSK